MSEATLEARYAACSKDPNGSLLILEWGDALQLLDDAERDGVYVLCFDAFHLHRRAVEPDMAMDSNVFPAPLSWSCGRQYLAEREGFGLHFEPYLEDEPQRPVPYLMPTLKETRSGVQATWTNRGDAPAEDVTLSVIAPPGSDLTDPGGERVHSQVYDRWGRYFYLGKVSVAPGEQCEREFTLSLSPDQPQRFALWSSAGARQTFPLE